MNYDEKAILYEMERVDLEYAIVKSLENSLYEHGNINVADRVQEAARYLQLATFALQDAHKWIGVSIGEQIKMDFMDG